MNNTPEKMKNNINENTDVTYKSTETENTLADTIRKASAKRRRHKKSRTHAAVLTAVILAAAIFGVFAFIGKRFTALPEAAGPGNYGSLNNDGVYGTSPDFSFENQEMRGVWIASVININFPSKPGLTEAELKSELDDIVKNTLEAGLNSIFFQVRPTADSLYPSAIFPYSKYLSGTQGVSPDNNFDCLKYLLDIASKNNIDVHAWVNPFRVTMYSTDEAGLAPNNPAVLHPEYTVKYADGKTYFNPGVPAVRRLIVDGVKELAVNYPTLAGIHFDDYFYPYPSGNAEFDDEKWYQMYGGGMSKADWRRHNVNVLIEDAYKEVKHANPNMKFGVSPFGIWANDSSDTPVKGSSSTGLEAYNSLYCDALAWAKGGYVDYLIPQIYWSFSTKTAPFDNVARWWNANLDGTGVDYYIGHAAYKVSDYDKNEIGIQVEFARNLMCYKGSVFYGYEDIKNNTLGLKDKLKQLNSYPIKYYNKGNTEIAKVNVPASSYYATSGNVTIVGESNTLLPLKINSTPVSRTKSGLFSYYGNISAGETSFTLAQNDTLSYFGINKSTRIGAGQSSGKMQITDLVPATDAWIMAGKELTVSCKAPAGSKVTAKIGGLSFELKQQTKPSSNSKYALVAYSGSVTPGIFTAEDSSCDLGTLKVTATLGSETVSLSGGLIKQMGQKQLIYGEVINDYSYLKISPSSSFYDDYTPASKGMRDYIDGLYDGYYKLRFGGYVAEENIQTISGIELNENRIVSVTAGVNGTDASNNKNNFTDVTFECVENAPVNAVASAGKIHVVFYNTASDLIPEPLISPNPMVSHITAYPENETTLCYDIHLKDELNFYGYNVVYKNGKIIVRLNNPQRLSIDPKTPLSGKTIVIDPGHGGTDIGAPGCGSINESQLNLDISLHLQKKLEALGATVLMTRTAQSQTVSLEERIAFLNNANPDLAVSVHQNSIDSSANAQKIRGYLGLYCAEAGKLLAKTVSSTVTDKLNRYERPYAYQKLAVARNHRFPSTLCEMCFISNVEEYEWSITEENTLRSAEAIAEGILNYYKAQEVYLAY